MNPLHPYRRLHLAVLWLNTAGLLGYLLWLIFGQQRIFYTQEGVLYLLPCLPFFFVFFVLLRSGKSGLDEDQGKDK